MQRLYEQLSLPHFIYVLPPLQVNGGDRTDGIYSNYFCIQTKAYYCIFTDGNILGSRLHC